MSNYDFHMLLEPLEFEKLVCDIVQQRDRIFLKTFKEGPDRGIDGLHDGDMKTIVQAKRCRPDFRRLYEELEQKELPKVRTLNPDRYILGIAMEVSPGEEMKIIELFEGYIQNNHDILNRKDLNRYLEDPTYKQILLKYPKLWLPNLNILEKVINESANRATFNESAEELKVAIKASKSFVPTRIYHDALQKWTQNHVIVLSGEPGVGKTTMAYMLALANLQPNKLEGFVWANSLQDVSVMWEVGKQQVFILDDFWGSIFFGDQSRRNDETRLEKLIRRVIDSRGEKRLILTTREYILQQGLQKHPLLRNTLDQFALITTMEDYGDDEKANILFSHLYASSLEYEYVHYLFMKTDWIVHHRNYNPRVLALFLSKSSSYSELSPEDYYEELSVYFDNPSEFWRSVFLELSTGAQIVAMLLLISSTPMHLENMKLCYDKYIHNCPFHMTVKNLGECIAELEKTIIKTVYDESYEAVLLKFSMPAVQDFLFEYLQENCELLIPKLLECCVYFNQLQFLLEHLARYCSESVSDRIVHHCITHYYDYDESILENDGSWNWDIDLLEESREHLHRFFHLLRCCAEYKHPTLYRFLESEINSYCLTMGNDDLAAKYHDLHNLPDIIARCANLGMTFDDDLLIRFYENSFSVFHYIAIQKFQDVFPEAYALFHKSYFAKMKSNIKSTILAELMFLFDYDMEIEIDLLIDCIPDILKKFGLRYTEKFGRIILDLCGREPTRNEKKGHSTIPSYREDSEQDTLESVKDDAWNWLLGPSETFLDDDQKFEVILNCNLSPEIKRELIITTTSLTPRYVYDLLQTKESIDLLIASLHGDAPHLPKQEYEVIMSMLSHIAQGDPALIQKLVLYCFECVHLFMYNKEPVMRIKHFMKSDIYIGLLENNPELRKIVFDHLLISDKQWIRFIHLPIYFYCFAFCACFCRQDEELETFYPELQGDNFSKFNQVIQDGDNKKNGILYAEYGPYYFKNYEWEGSLYRIFEEQNPYHFNQYFVAPRIISFLESLGEGDEESKVMNLLSLSKLHFEYTSTGHLYCFFYEMSDELCMIEYLGIAEIWDGDFPTKLTKKKLVDLQKDGLARIDDDKWNVMVYKITNLELLKEWGVYDSAVNFLKKVEVEYSRFQDGDYSAITQRS